MAQTICCPCGNPIDCDQVDLVITVACPRCNRELPLELDGAGDARRAMLTIMEGPHWIGERFILPVDIELVIGNASGRWLSLDAVGVADSHCRLRLAPEGALLVEDLGSQHGTWIGQQRIARGKLGPAGSFRVGPFRFRLDILTPGGTVIAPAARDQSDSTMSLPQMARVRGKQTPAHWVAKNRYIVARWIVVATGILGGVDWTFFLRGRTVAPWPWHKAIIAGLAVWLALSIAGRRVTLVHKHLKFLSLAALLVVAVAALAAGATALACAALFAAAAIVVLILREPGPALALCAAAIGLIGVATLALNAWQAVNAITGR